MYVLLSKFMIYLSMHKILYNVKVRLTIIKLFNYFHSFIVELFLFPGPGFPSLCKNTESWLRFISKNTRNVKIKDILEIAVAKIKRIGEITFIKTPHILNITFVKIQTNFFR